MDKGAWEIPWIEGYRLWSHKSQIWQRLNNNTRHLLLFPVLWHYSGLHYLPLDLEYQLSHSLPGKLLSIHQSPAPGNSPAVQQLELCTFTAKGVDLIPNQRTEILKDAWQGQKKPTINGPAPTLASLQSLSDCLQTETLNRQELAAIPRYSHSLLLITLACQTAMDQWFSPSIGLWAPNLFISVTHNRAWLEEGSGQEGILLGDKDISMTTVTGRWEVQQAKGASRRL